MNPYWVVAALAAFVQFWLFVKWIYRRIRDDQIQRAFIRDMAVNHLPHIYGALRLIAKHNGIALPEPPTLRWLELDREGNRDLW